MQFQQLMLSQIIQTMEAPQTRANQLTKSIEKAGNNSFETLLKLLSIQNTEAFKEEVAISEDMLPILGFPWVSNLEEFTDVMHQGELTREKQEPFETSSFQAIYQTSLKQHIDNQDKLPLGSLFEKVNTRSADNKIQINVGLTEYIAENSYKDILTNKLGSSANKMDKHENSANSIVIKEITLEKQGEMYKNILVLQSDKNASLNNEGRLAKAIVFPTNDKAQENSLLSLSQENEASGEIAELKSPIKNGHSSHSNSNGQEKLFFAKTENSSNQLHSSNQLESNNFLGILEQSSFNNTSDSTEQQVPIKELPEFLLKQITTKVKVNKLDGSSEVSLKLKPEELGKLTLQLTAHSGQVSVKILTENHHARELVVQNLSQLKQSLTDQGIKFNSIDVQVGSDSNFQHFFGQQSNPFNQSRQSGKNKIFNSSRAKNEQNVEFRHTSEVSKYNGSRGLGNLEILA